MDEPKDMKFDISELKAVSRGNQAFLQNMFKIYQEDFGSYLRELDLAWSAKNHDEVLRLAHKMKSPAGLIKVSRIDELLLEIEGLKSDELAEETDLIGALKATFNQINKALESEINAMQGND